MLTLCIHHTGFVDHVRFKSIKHMGWRSMLEEVEPPFWLGHFCSMGGMMHMMGRFAQVRAEKNSDVSGYTSAHPFLLALSQAN